MVLGWIVIWVRGIIALLGGVEAVAKHIYMGTLLFKIALMHPWLLFRLSSGLGTFSPLGLNSSSSGSSLELHSMNLRESDTSPTTWTSPEAQNSQMNEKHPSSQPMMGRQTATELVVVGGGGPWRGR